LVQERDLAEVAAGTELPPILSANGDLRLAGLDQEEADTALPFRRHGVARREGSFLHRRSDALELFPVEIGEERNALEEIDCALCHARTMPHWNGETHGRRLFAGLAQPRRRSVGLPRRGVGAALAGLRTGRAAAAARAGR